MNYIKVKREEIDKCNICGEFKKLTWDHVPPKSAGNDKEVDVNTLYKGIPTEHNYQKRYRSGIKYRSICSQCNNVLLSSYDNAYKKFVLDIKQLLATSIVLPEVVQIPVEINKVCRAICGHLLAAKDFYDDQSMIDSELRKYIVNIEYKINKDYRLYYWIYPYNTIYIVRDFVVKSNSKKVAFPVNPASSIASYPIALILEEGVGSNCGLVDLLQYTTDDINEVVTVPIDFRSSYYPGTDQLRDFRWPCNIGDEWDSASFILGGDAMRNDSRIGIVKKNI